MTKVPKLGLSAGARRVALTGLVLAGAAAPVGAQDLDQLQRQRLFSKVKPAVVLVYSSAQAEITIPRADGTALVLESEVAGHGSGWIITPDGFVVTNGHVVTMFHESNEVALRQLLLHQALTDAGVFQQVDETTGRVPTEQEAIEQTLEIYAVSDIALKKDLYVVLQNGRALDASVREYSPPIVPVAGKVSLPGVGSFTSGRDVAVLKVAARDLPTIRLGDSDRSAIGEEVFAAGYPAAADLSTIDAASRLQASFTRGQISSLKAAVGGSDLVQIDAATSKGNSGGPVFNRDGDVLGIVTMGQGENFGYAVTSNTIREFFRASGAVVGESLFDRTWDRALDAYYGGEYGAAVGAFDEVLRVMPDLPDALALRRTAMAEREAGNRGPPPLAAGEAAAPAEAATLPVQPAGPGGDYTWLIVFTGLGVVLVGAGLYMRRQAAPAVVSGGPALSSGGPSSASLAPPAAPGTLRVTGGPLAGNTFRVDPAGLRIGRDPAACQIVLSETSVSREHAVIRPNGGSLSIKNLSGTNPTYVNDRAIQEATLTGGDKVKIGDSVFMVEA